MRDFYDYNHHPAVLRERFPKKLWPQCEDPKGEDEAWTFIKFAEAACLSLDSAPKNLSGDNRPDLECSIGGQRTLFELTEIVDTHLAAALSKPTAGSSSYSAHDSLDRMLRRKLSKPYVTDGLPLQLLLYYDVQSPWMPFYFLFQRERELAPLVESKFKRIWIYSRGLNSVLGWFEGTSAGLRVTFDFDLESRFNLNAPLGRSYPEMWEEDEQA